MKVTVEYSGGTWEFSVEGSGGYVDNFEVITLEDAVVAAAGLMKEISQADEDDDDPFDDLFKEE